MLCGYGPGHFRKTLENEHIEIPCSEHGDGAQLVDGQGVDPHGGDKTDAELRAERS